MTGYAERLVTARKPHHCEDYPACPEGGIKRGQDYVRAVAFPGDVTDHVWVMRLCLSCWTTKFGRPIPTRGRPSPPTAPLTPEQPPADHGGGSGAGGRSGGEGA